MVDGDDLSRCHRLIAIKVNKIPICGRLVREVGGDYYTMSEEVDKISCCASCGIAEGGDVKLKDCSACRLVKYCGIECQRKHRRQHKKKCKKRTAELRDEILFKQPESSHYGDCPICCLPLPLDMQKHFFMVCCSKVICFGCHYADHNREFEGRLNYKCPFCRHPIPISQSREDFERILMKRVEANDPVAMGQMGFQCNKAGDYGSAVEYWKRAANLGDMEAHFNLSVMYYDGHGVEKDEKKQVYHLEEASIGGHPDARYYLGGVEEKNGRLDRAIKHWIIAANLGSDKALEALKNAYRYGLISKDDFASALRAHQAAVDATKSPQREEGEAARKQEE